MTTDREIENEEFRAFCGGRDPRTIAPDVRLQLWARFKAGSPVSSSGAQLRRELETRYGSVGAAPVIERAKLARLETAPPGPPKRVASVSSKDLAQQPARELERLERELADAERVRVGETLNMRHYLDAQAQRIRERIVALRKRAAA